MLLIGLIGFAATMLVFSFVEILVAVYAERFLSGLFSAAVTPVAGATIGSLVTTEQGARSPHCKRQSLQCSGHRRRASSPPVNAHHVFVLSVLKFELAVVGAFERFADTLR